MCSKSYSRKRIARRKAWSLNAHAANDRKRLAEAAQWRDVGGFVTDGILGAHAVRLMAKDDEGKYLAVSVDGAARQSRTFRGVLRCMAEMVSRKGIR